MTLILEHREIVKDNPVFSTRLSSFIFSANFFTYICIAWCCFKMSFSRTVQQVEFAFSKSVPSMPHEGCCLLPHPSWHLHFCIDVSCGYMGISYVLAEGPFAPEFLFICYRSIFLKGLQEGSYNEWSSHFLHYLFEACQMSWLFHRSTIRSERCFVETEGLLP